ncbi:aldo/keto reductase [Saccharothrix sp. ALI-22-I]|uniref:aldo/keto reductase n=1 Tax=Saccharothrix sp. ALI-22-I TaxID=1933778 RepID=UPI00097BFEAB|nr:aldo/keto reductase [Saccharothrix sp. ALI-22-I]ONI92088.1 aldo/keto reductase [Saccharothrix sp. ALI-22-I]
MATDQVAGDKNPLPRLGLGTSPLGNLYTEVTDSQARAVVDAAWEAGVRSFDTAPHYGLGLAERRLGAALADRPRAEFVLSTKVGRLLVPDPAGAGRRDDDGFAVPATQRRVWDFSAAGVLRSLESSLERLGLDRVDVVYVHDPDDHWDQAVGEAVPALVELREQGVIGAVGVGMNQWRMPARFVRESDVDVVMLAGRYTLLEQPALAEFLPLCAERGVDVVVAGVFNSGLLAQHEVPDDATHDYRAAPADLIDRARRIAAVCARHGTTLPAAALWFPFGHPAVTGAVVGARTEAEIRANVAALTAPPPLGLWAELRGEGLLAADAPAP